MIKGATATVAPYYVFIEHIAEMMLYASVKFRCPVLIPRVFYSHNLAAALGGFLGVDAGNSHGKSLLQRNGGFFFIQERVKKVIEKRVVHAAMPHSLRVICISGGPFEFFQGSFSKR